MEVELQLTWVAPECSFHGIQNLQGAFQKIELPKCPWETQDSTYAFFGAPSILKNPFKGSHGKSILGIRCVCFSWAKCLKSKPARQAAGCCNTNLMRCVIWRCGHFQHLASWFGGEFTKSLGRWRIHIVLRGRDQQLKLDFKSRSCRRGKDL